MTKPLLCAVVLASIVLVGCKSGDDASLSPTSDAVSVSAEGPGRDQGMTPGAERVTAGPGNATADERVGSKIGGK